MGIANLHGHPDVLELLEAVRDFVNDDVLPATEGRVQFHCRVAARVLEIVARELLDGPAQTRHHAERLSELGYVDDDELVRAIRHGSHDGDIMRIAEVLASGLEAKVQVVNPGYLTR